MEKSSVHFGLSDVCEFYNFSQSTVRRKLRESREGLSTFPLPLFRRGSRLLWRKEDILNWRGEGTITNDNDESTMSQ